MTPSRSRVVPTARAAPLALAFACTSVLADADLAVRLSPGAAPGEIVFELANEGDVAVSVLRTGTPLEPVLAEDAFDVRRGVKGWPVVELAPYVGRVYKRGAPGPEDFVELPPGRALSSTVALGDSYEVPVAGDYRVSFEGAILVAPDGPGHAPNEASGSPAARARRHVHASGELVDATPADAGPIAIELRPGSADARARPPTFNGCGADRQGDIVEATSAAETIAADSLDALLSTPEAERAAAPRYARWFGAHSPARYATVANGFDAILDSLSGATLNYDCTCAEANTFAYVYPFQLHDVYLCPLFFEADLLGTDSRAGTIVHELSHFRALVGTDDHRYGTSAVAALATDDPDLAVDNADSYEYFAENTPALSMSAGGGPVAPPGPLVPDVPDTTPPADGPAGGPRFATLALGTPARGRLAEGELATYEVDGADTISLSSLSGDADLYVFDDPALGEGSLVCSAAAFSQESTLDACELPPGGTRYAAVYGYTAADYEIVAEARGVPAPQAPAPVSLASGGSDAGTLGAEGLALYTVAAPARLELTSSEGNADLYVFVDDSLSPDALACASDLPSGVDVCELTGAGTAHVAVYSAAGSGYSLAVLGPGEGSGADAPGTPDAPPTTAPGSGPVQTPTSTPTPTPMPTSTPTPVPAEDDPDVVVAGVPASGDPSPGSSSSGGSSGGGALGWTGLGLLGAALGARRGRRERRAVAATGTGGTHAS